jgi:caffeoyl-CoA O-methyltransferase
MTMNMHPRLSRPSVTACGLVVLVALAARWAAPQPVSAQAQAPRAQAASASGGAQLAPDLQKLLGQIRQVDTGQLAVSEEDGRMLRVLAASSRAKRALEIGSASGYSAIWIGLGLRETGGRLVTIEYDPVRAREAAENVRRAGLADIVQVVHGDGFKEIPKLAGTFDFVFLDAWKRDYKRFLDMVLPRMGAGGLFLAHNVVNKGSDMPDFLDAIEKNPNLITAIVTPSGEGISISMKRR